MRVTSLCFTLILLVLTLFSRRTQNSDSQRKAFLRINPNRQQHFVSSSVSFECVGLGRQAELRRTRDAEDLSSTSFLACGETSARSCTVDRVYAEDSGDYWCESDGARSDEVHVTVTDAAVIVDVPALPVVEGTRVSLLCISRNQATGSTLFSKGDVIVQVSDTRTMEITNVSKSHEGSYKCEISGAGSSPSSFLAVTDNPTSVTLATTNHTDEESASRFSNILRLVVVATLSVVLPLLGLSHLHKHRGYSE